jgi:hypothetical protein
MLSVVTRITIKMPVLGEELTEKHRQNGIWFQRNTSSVGKLLLSREYIVKINVKLAPPLITQIV